MCKNGLIFSNQYQTQDNWLLNTRRIIVIAQLNNPQKVEYGGCIQFKADGTKDIIEQEMATLFWYCKTHNFLSAKNENR